MKEEKGPQSTASLAVLLLFAAVLFSATPAEASIPRAGVAGEASASLQIYELASSAPAITPSRFGFSEDVSLLDAEHAPRAFSLIESETSRCERTYARNNPLKYVDPDGQAIALAPAAMSAASATASVGGAIAGTVVAGMLVHMAVERFAPGVNSRFEYEYGIAGSNAGAIPGSEENVAPLERRKKDKDSTDDSEGGHESGQRPSTKEKHEKGDERRRRDKGGEKKDPRMPYRRKGALHFPVWVIVERAESGPAA